MPSVTLAYHPPPVVTISPGPVVNVQVNAPPPVNVVVASVGLQGPPGLGATLSADPGNTLSTGSDGGLFSPSALGSDGGLDLTLLFDNQLI